MSFGIPVRNGLMLGLGASTALSTRAGAKPAMFLNFLQPFLDSRITFSRGTNATLIDSTGRLTYAPNNLVLWSEDFTQSSQWGLNNVTVAANATTSPTGVATADKINEDTATGVHRLAFAPAFALAPHTLSVYAKAAERNWIAMGNASDGQLVFFNLSNGTIGTIIGTITPSITGVGDGWYRCSVTFTPSIAAMRTCVFNVCPSDNVTNYTGVTGNGIFLWGAQLEQVTYQTTPGTYNATTAAAYYGPRFDYDPVTLAPRGLLIEEARTNLLTYSEQFDNAAWVVQRSTITANATSSPSGTVSADKLVEDTTASNTHFVLQTATVLASTTYTYSVFLKAAERTRASLQDGGGSSAVGNFDLSNGTVISTSGATATITNMGNGWYRCAITFATIVAQTTANCRVFLIDTGTNTSYTGNGTSGIFVWGADLEAGSFATSYIPTVASTVTRNADVATMTGTNFSSWYNQSAGTFVMDADSLTISAVNFLLTAGDGTGNNRFGFYRSSASIAGYIVTGGVTQMEIITTNAVTPNIPFKVAAGATANDGNASFNGNIGANDTTITMPSVNQLNIGNNAGGGFHNGHIRTIAYFNTRLPNAQLQTLTAPSLAPTLSLDFTSGSYNVGF